MRPLLHGEGLNVIESLDRALMWGAYPLQRFWFPRWTDLCRGEGRGYDYCWFLYYFLNCPHYNHYQFTSQPIYIIICKCSSAHILFSHQDLPGPIDELCIPYAFTIACLHPQLDRATTTNYFPGFMASNTHLVIVNYDDFRSVIVLTLNIHSSLTHPTHACTLQCTFWLTH